MRIALLCKHVYAGLVLNRNCVNMRNERGIYEHKWQNIKYKPERVFNFEQCK